MIKVLQNLGIIGLLCLFSCQKVDNTALIGAWQGVEIRVNDQVSPNDASTFQLVMREDETYTLTNMEGATENGVYFTRMGTLYLKTEKVRKAFILERQTPDSLSLKVEGKFTLVLDVARRI